jgi:hypothetical protein
MHAGLLMWILLTFGNQHRARVWYGLAEANPYPPTPHPFLYGCGVTYSHIRVVIETRAPAGIGGFTLRLMSRTEKLYS